MYLLTRAVAFGKNNSVLQIALDLSRSNTKAVNYGRGQGELAV